MDKQTLQDMIRRYSAELMQTAARSRLPREETPAQETPPPQAPAPAAAPLFLETIPEAEAPPDAAPLLEETEEGPVEINPPESGPGQDPLQPIQPENDTYAQFLEENPKTGWLRIQAYTGMAPAPLPAQRRLSAGSLRTASMFLPPYRRMKAASPTTSRCPRRISPSPKAPPAKRPMPITGSP